MTYTFQCGERGCFKEHTLHTQPAARCTGLTARGRGFNQSVIIHVTASVTTGQTYEKYVTWMSLQRLKPIPKNTYYRIAHTIVWPRMIEISKQVMAATRVRLSLQCKRLVLAIDGGWFTRGWHSFFACLPVLDWATGAIVRLYFVKHSHAKQFATKRFEHTGNIPYSSKASESFMIEMLCDDLVASAVAQDALLPILDGVCIDGDSSASLVIKSHVDERIRNLAIHGDNGHNKKNLVKRVKELCGSVDRFSGIARRVGLMFIGIVKARTAQAKLDMANPERQIVGTSAFAKALQVPCVSPAWLEHVLSSVHLCTLGRFCHDT